MKHIDSYFYNTVHDEIKIIINIKIWTTLRNSGTRDLWLKRYDYIWNRILDRILDDISNFLKNEISAKIDANGK